MATNPQLLTVMIGANDMISYTAEQVIARLESWSAPIRAAGVKIAYSPPTPYRDAEPRHPSYDDYTARRAALLATVREPSGWSRFADAYIPMGEHPDFMDPALIPDLYGDGVHPTGPVASTTSGPARLHAVYEAAMRSLLDGARADATAPYASVWPSDETNLSPATPVTRRIILAGLAHAGVADGIAVTGAQVRLNGGPWSATLGRVYNGDVIDVRITTATAAGGSAGYDLRIGSETRHITLTSVAAVTPVRYRHGGIRAIQPQASLHLHDDLHVASAGIAVLAIKGGGPPPVEVTVDGVAATRRFSTTGDGYFDLWTTPIAAAGTIDVVVRHPGYLGQSVLAWGVVENADPTPTQIDAAWPPHQPAPHATAPLVVPHRGIGLALFGEYGGETVVPATVRAGSSFVDEGRGTFQGETHGICLATREDSGTSSFDYAFGSYPRGAIVFKAAGS